MSVQRYEFSPNSENLYEEIRELVHSLYLKKDYIGSLHIKHQGFLVCSLHSHSNVVRKLKCSESIPLSSCIDRGLLEFEFTDIPTQTVQLKTSDHLDTIQLEARTRS